MSAQELVESVPDPELPFLTIKDLGVLRSVVVEGSSVRVTVTPTYSGCPALDAIRDDVEKVLQDNGFTDVVVETVLSPAWTTDWLSASARASLAAHGIAPPGQRGPVAVTLGAAPSVRCPQCGSGDTEETSRFGPTACKGLWRCRSCREPFEHLKAH